MKVLLNLKSVNPLLKPKPFPVLIIFFLKKVYFLDMGHGRKKNPFILQKNVGKWIFWARHMASKGK